MDKKPQEILEMKPDLLEREVALFIRRAGNYLFGKKNMWQYIEIISFTVLGISLISKWLGWR